MEEEAKQEIPKEKVHRSVGKKIVRIFFKTLLFLFLFIVLVFLLILTPPVQRFLTGKVENYLTGKLHTKVEIGRISFGLSGNVSLENVYIEDKTKDTLVSGGAIKAHINILKIFSGEYEVKDIELQNITAKIKRELPDTTFNFQFIVDAFTSGPKKEPDTTASAPLKLDISDVTLDNINLVFKDVITGSDLFAHLGYVSATIDSLNLEKPAVRIPTFIMRNVQARMKQVKPLVEPGPLSEDIAQAAKPSTFQFSFGTIDLNKVSVDYGNDVSAFYTTANIGRLKVDGKQIDLPHNKIHLDELGLTNSKITVRLGKKEAAKEVAKQAGQEVEAQAAAGWDFRVDKLNVDNNTILFDNDNNTALASGMDYSHIAADSLTLHINNLVYSADSMAAQIAEGHVKEKSGLRLNTLQGDIVYAGKQTSIKNLLIRTPGTEIKRSLTLDYPSIEALTKNPQEAQVDIDIVDSKVQVKDILLFAPQLRSNPALRNPNDVWHFNLVAGGNVKRLVIDQLQFTGLRNTQLNARGTAVNIMDPKKVGGDFTISRFHTTQTDIALFTGKRLSTAQISLPEDLNLSGHIAGNTGLINANMSLVTTSGNVALDGRFSNVTDPKSATYNATVRTRSLQIGRIIKQPAVFGALTGTFTVSGRSFDPKTVNVKFSGNIPSFSYNKYAYRNIKFDGLLNGETFTAHADVADPNADLNLTASGNFSAEPSFKISGMIDSIKALPLGLTTQELIFRGAIDGTVSNISADNVDADVMIRNMLLVSGTKRLALDTVQFQSGRTDTANFIRFKSDIVNANIQGQYSLSELGSVIQNTMQPYFSTAALVKPVSVQPYNFTFSADAVYDSIFAVFAPGFDAMEPLHAEGTFTNGGGARALVTTPYLKFGTNEVNNLALNVATADSALRINGNVAHIKSGTSLDLYNARINASASNNNIDFRLGIDDKAGRTKYTLGGLLTQPQTGTFALSLKPDSLLLNYAPWTIPADNSITVGKTAITAQNFVLGKGGQQLSIASIPGGNGTDQPLQVKFTDFRLATITGFVKPDSVLVDGVMNGVVTLQNVLQQPSFTTDLTIANLSMMKDTIGNVAVKVSSADTKTFTADVTITGQGNDIALTGTVSPAGKDMALDLNLAIRQLQLKSIQGALASAITNASGTITGGVKVGGTTAAPEINGDLAFNKTSFALTALGSQFSLDNQKLAVSNKGIVFNQFTIADSASNKLVIDGNILTDNFINYDFNLDIKARNFQALNTPKRPNQVYYGKLNINSNIHISGTEAKPVVDGSVTVNDGTNLSVVVPQAEPGVQQREGIVRFVDMDAPGNDTLFRRYDSVNHAGVMGLDVTANIEIKKEAVFNVIVDETNGDFLNVQGEAQLSTGIDPSGKITMVGTYEIEQGGYQISYNFLQRKFDIQKGSKITWTGEPTTADVDVTAVYVANTAPLDLVADQLSDNTNRNIYLQKLPFEVHLNVAGQLLKPVITFDVLLPENKNYGVSNDIVTAVQTRLAQIRQDEGEINKQVFSLLLLGRFTGQNPFQSSGGGGFDAGSYARQSVSKLLTEQLNNLAGDLIAGVDLNFDVASNQDYTTGEKRDRTDLNVGLSKRLLNDRLKISVGSNFQLEGPQNSNQRNNNIAGNVAADYQLSKDGRYLLRFYRRNEYEGIVDGYIIETGLSFILSVDYNRFKQIFQKRRPPKSATPPVQTPPPAETAPAQPATTPKKETE